jgi:undecaprenyl-diphosphatase
MPIPALVILAVVQGLAELLPVSSSAHVIVATKLLGIDPTTPEMTLLLVALHSGTMLAVIVYFWRAWRQTYFSSWEAFRRIAARLVYSTVLTAAVGYPIVLIIEKAVLRSIPNADVELIFGNLAIMSAALAAAGILIVYSGRRSAQAAPERELGWHTAGWVGAVQGLCLPFRGFSRSGATISTGLLTGAGRARAEQYSFALAVLLTPPVVLREVKRLLAAHPTPEGGGGLRLFFPDLLGAGLAFLAGLLALAWLSRWLERGAWQRFGYYCLAAAAAVFGLHLLGY